MWHHIKIQRKCSDRNHQSARAAQKQAAHCWAKLIILLIGHQIKLEPNKNNLQLLWKMFFCCSKNADHFPVWASQFGCMLVISVQTGYLWSLLADETVENWLIFWKFETKKVNHEIFQRWNRTKFLDYWGRSDIRLCAVEQMTLQRLFLGNEAPDSCQSLFPLHCFCG